MTNLSKVFSPNSTFHDVPVHAARGEAQDAEPDEAQAAPEQYDVPAAAASHYDVPEAPGYDEPPGRDCDSPLAPGYVLQARDSPPVHASPPEPHYGSAHYSACSKPSHVQALPSYLPDDKP